MNTKAPIVILGLSKDQKPRAATFAPEDTEAATKAAGLMGLRLARAETPEALALVKQLPQGKVFATGKGLLPLVKRDVYDKLLKAITLADPKTTQDAAKPGSTSASQHACKPTQSPTTGAKVVPTRDGNPAQSPAVANTRWNDPWALVTTGSTVLYSTAERSLCNGVTISSLCLRPSASL
jgi:hypothetical protein